MANIGTLDLILKNAMWQSRFKILKKCPIMCYHITIYTKSKK
jgi:hypothetical protein